MNYIFDSITNTELALLEIIMEKRETTGYEIGQIIEERGYREWANIGKTSIYGGIRKLERKGLAVVKAANKKQGKGPLPNRIKLTGPGKKVLVEEIQKALLSQKNLPLYYLGIAGIGLIKKETALKVLRQREAVNRKIIEEINRIFKRKGGNSLPLEARALFAHPVSLIESDNKFLKKFITEFKAKEKKQRSTMKR